MTKSAQLWSSFGQFGSVFNPIKHYENMTHVNTRMSCKHIQIVVTESCSGDSWALKHTQIQSYIYQFPRICKSSEWSGKQGLHWYIEINIKSQGF